MKFTFKNTTLDINKKNLTDFFLPPCCLICSMEVVSSDLPVCQSCLPVFQDLLIEKCKICRNPLPVCTCYENLGDLFLFWYNQRTKPLMYKVKNRCDTRQIGFLAALMEQRLKENYKMTFDAVTYVPRREKALKKQGFDQAQQLAKALADRLSLPCVTAFKRIGNTEQKVLNAMQRLNPKQKRYSVLLHNLQKTEEELYSRIILVDDIITTGATIAECKRVLKNAKIKSVSAIVLAKTPKYK